MNLFTPPREERPELLDSSDPTETEFAGTLRDIARVNRFLGGTQAVLSALDSLLATVPAQQRSQPVRILDVATGSADIMRAVARAARRGRWGAGRKWEIVATDYHDKVLAVARQWTPPADYPEITIAPADAFALPYPDKSFDVALCSMAFHHFGPQSSVVALREMRRVTRTGFVVNDLIRHRVARALIWATTRVVSRNRLTRNDAPLSVLRAFTLPEYAALARQAGIHNFDVRRVPLFRAVLIARNDFAR